ncbi:MAG: ComEC/Rec2 family competence protein [Sarcina sp.]
MNKYFNKYDVLKDKLSFKKPIIDILISVFLGILIYLHYEEMGISIILLITIAIITISYFILYDKNCFIILMLFLILGIIFTGSYYNFSRNKEGIFTARVEKTYKNYYKVTSKGRELYLYSDIPLKENYKIIFDGKFKKDIEIENGIVGHFFIKNFKSEKSDIITKLREINTKYYEYISEKVGQENAAIVTALVFGNKNFIDKNELNIFKNIGILHLICISGFHIIFLYSIIRKILPRSISILAIIIYVILTGATVSSIRALYMLLILEGAKLTTKNYNSVNSLALASFLILLIKPHYIFDVGFLFSVLATLGIFMFSKLFKRIFYRLPNCMNTSISLSLSAQVFIYPIMILSFKSFSMNFILGSFILTPYIYIALPISLISFLCFFISLDISILDFVIKNIFDIFRIIVKYLDFWAVKIYYVDEFYAVIYISILILFYVIYKGYVERKYYKFSFVLMFLLLCSNYTMFTTIEIYRSGFNSAIIIQDGFTKVSYTSSKSTYFLDMLKKEYEVNNIRSISDDIILSKGISEKIIIKPKIDESFIMLRGNNYDIIDMLNRDEKIIVTNKKVYIKSN